MIQPGIRKLVQHDAIDHERRRDAKGDDVRQRIELAPEGALVAAEPREPAIERIENAGSEDAPDGDVKFLRRGGFGGLSRPGVAPAWISAPSRILSVAAKPQKRFPAVIRFGRR